MRKFLIIILLFIAGQVFAAWPYTQNFDGLSTADLTGQDSWSGADSYDVQTSVILEGTKSVGNVAAGEMNIVRAVTTSTDGQLRFLHRRADTGTLITKVQIATGAIGGTSAACAINFTDAAAIVIQAVSLGAYSADTTYTLDLEYDVSTDQCRGRVDGGAWSDWANFDNAQTQITDIRFRNDNSAETGRYWDAIGPTPAAAAIAAPQRRNIQPLFIN